MDENGKYVVEARPVPVIFPGMFLFTDVTAVEQEMFEDIGALFGAVKDDRMSVEDATHAAVGYFLAEVRERVERALDGWTSEEI